MQRASVNFAETTEIVILRIAEIPVGFGDVRPLNEAWICESHSTNAQRQGLIRRLASSVHKTLLQNLLLVTGTSSPALAAVSGFVASDTHLTLKQ